MWGRQLRRVAALFVAARAREGNEQATALQILQESGSGEMLLEDLKEGLGRAIQRRQEKEREAKQEDGVASEGRVGEAGEEGTEAAGKSSEKEEEITVGGSAKTAALMAVYSLVAAGLIRIDREAKENTVVSLLA